MCVWEREIVNETKRVLPSRTTNRCRSLSTALSNAEARARTFRRHSRRSQRLLLFYIFFQSLVLFIINVHHHNLRQLLPLRSNVYCYCWFNNMKKYTRDITNTIYIYIYIDMLYGYTLSYYIITDYSDGCLVRISVSCQCRN